LRSDFRANVRTARHAVLVHLTADTWAVVAATVGAAFLGGIVTYLGSALQQRRQDKRDSRIRTEGAVAELLSSALDILIGVRTIREAYARRTRPRFYLRVAGVLWSAVPELTNWRVLVETETLRSLLQRTLELEHDLTESSRVIALDLNSVVVAKLTTFFTVAAMLTLGEDKQITKAVRELTPKVTAVVEATGARKRKFERLEAKLQKGLEDLRELADKRLGNVRRPRFWHRKK
jgi:hypothetical protein